MTTLLSHPAIRELALPISVEQYHRLGEAGIIAQRTELIQGVIFEKMIKSPEHTWIVQWLVESIGEQLGKNEHVRQEQPLTLAASEPEPDLAIVAGSKSDYRTEHPRTAELVVEVAITSEALDREKAADFASAGVVEYWLVLPKTKTVEVRRQPAAGEYQELQVFDTSELNCEISMTTQGGSRVSLQPTTIFSGN